MSKKTNLLQSVFDELNKQYERLHKVWGGDGINSLVDKNEILECSNNILTLLRILYNTDFGEDTETALDRMRSIREDMKILAWAAVYSHLRVFITELEEGSRK